MVKSVLVIRGLKYIMAMMIFKFYFGFLGVERSEAKR